jgi:Pectate lyase superfamily protein
MKTVHVSYHGIVGDGKTDNSERLKALIAKVPEGTTLQFPPGRFHFSEVIDCSRVKIQGSTGGETVMDGSFFSGSFDSVCLDFSKCCNWKGSVS